VRTCSLGGSEGGSRSARLKGDVGTLSNHRCFLTAFDQVTGDDEAGLAWSELFACDHSGVLAICDAIVTVTEL
jgi:hypothetical protein